MAQSNAEFREVTPETNSLRPRLNIEIQFQPGQRTFDIIDGESRIFVDTGGLRYLGEASLNEKGKTVRQNSPMGIEFGVDLTHEDLEQIEDCRGGDDLNIQLETDLLGKDHNDDLQRTSVTTEGRIPQSDWADILSTFNYGEIQILELRFPDSPAQEHFRNAWDHIEDADAQFTRGNWGETMTHARKAMDVLDTLESKSDLSSVLGEEKWDRLGSAKGGLKRFLDLGPHSTERIGHEPYNRRDAQVALLMAKAMINYVADGLREDK